MKRLRVRRWETEDLGHRLRFLFFRLMGWNDKGIVLLFPVSERHAIRVATINLVIHRNQAFWVRAYISKNPAVLRYNLVWEPAAPHVEQWELDEWNKWLSRSPEFRRSFSASQSNPLYEDTHVSSDYWDNLSGS